MENKLTHFDQDGKAIMVDVSEKENTQRIAVAKGSIYLGKDAFFAVKQGNIKKGDVLGVARVAGIMAAKRTFEMIPMCHPLLLTKCNVDFYLKEESYEIEALCMVKVNGKTGVEMEALTGVNIALLTIYDMCKAVNKSMEIGDIHLVEKQGGKSGHYKKEEKQPIVFAVSGFKKAGKTSLIERLIPLLKEEGYTIGTMKHDGHLFTLDEEGTDTDRHKKAGAKSVTIYSKEQTIYRGEQHTLQELTKMHKEIDVLIVEGLKESNLPKVEIIKEEENAESVCRKETLLAIVTDKPYAIEGVPSFKREEVNLLFEFLKKYIEEEKNKRRIQNA